MAALAPDQKEPVKATFRVTPVQALDIYDSSYLGQVRTLQPGQQASWTQHLFAGAKTVPVLDEYTKAYGIPSLEYAVDWGVLRIITRPIFALLEFFFHHVGSIGTQPRNGLIGSRW